MELTISRRGVNELEIGVHPKNKIIISIYTLNDLGDLSDLIGSLPRTIQQYSPPIEWIMYELGVFPIFCRE